MASPGQILSHASNFQIYNSVFTTGDANVTYHGAHLTRDANQDHPILLSDILKCPAPSQYFVGREDALKKLSKIFSEPLITLWSTNTEVIHDFLISQIKSKLHVKCPCVFLDASSAQALNASLAAKNREQAFPTKFLLVLENANGSVVEDHIHNLPDSPILVTSTEPAISKLASFTACNFQLSDGATQQEMQKVLSSIEKALEPKQQATAIVANGGTGKTQIVLQFVSKNISRFSNIWFFDAASNDILAANFKALGTASGVGEEVKNVRDFLGKRKENWLCIFDNADDKQVILKDYIPSCNHGNVIVTSRLKETLQMASPECYIDLSDLKREDAVELLLKQSHDESSKKNQDLAARIVDAFGCHALAVSTAGAYIGVTPTCNLRNYLTHLTKILKYETRSLDAYKLTVFDACQLSFSKLHYSTKYLMQICAYLNPVAIPVEIFTRAAACTDSDTSSVDVNPPTKAIEAMEEFLSLFVKKESWEDSVVELCQLSLASYEDVKKLLVFHPVIQTCAQETVANQEHMKQTALLLLGRATPFGGLIEAHILRHQLLIQACSIQIEEVPTVHVKICLSRILREGGLWSKCELLEREVLAQHKAVLGEHHPDTLTSMSNLALTYQEQGNLDAAQQLQEQELAQRKVVLGEHHPSTLTSMSNLALTYKNQGNLDAAQQLQEQVLAQRKVVLGEHHPSTLTSMSNLALTYKNQGNLDAAQQLQEQVLAQRKVALGEHHPDTLNSMNNLALTYWKQGNLDAAQQLQEQVLAQFKVVLGEHHPDTLTSMSNLALTYQDQGNLDAAQQLQEQDLAQCKAVLGEHHPDTLTSMGNLASTYQNQGNLDVAQQLQEQELAQRKVVLGEHHPSTLTSMHNLALTYEDQGNLDAAQQLQEQMRKISLLQMNLPEEQSCTSSVHESQLIVAQTMGSGSRLKRFLLNPCKRLKIWKRSQPAPNLSMSST
ncbi:TPR-like protein [Gymnopus androsaceus JB14]|uniref:TPR-like protein n=1 Tax=Gymnopus androsaceus JB14 TaxID=1447944 RepID=A0A6A4H6G7_9AGAR|nr:TPR-like protein [Gymnopus androsaceus JB14]